MPEMSAGRRASGGGVWMRDPLPRHYGPDNTGGLCDECGGPMPAALAGDTRHLTCDPDWPALVKRSQRAVAKARRERDNG